MDRMADEWAIRSLIEKWVVWRDSGDWGRFATVWHADARMIATWYDGPAAEFISRSREGWSKGVNVTHTLGGTVVDFNADRALAQTKMTITQRVALKGIPADVICTGRFYDFFEKRNRVWGLVVRQCIYENDRLTPVEPGRAIQIDPAVLARFPQGYCHLGYIQELSGMSVTLGLPGRTGSEVEALYARGNAWLHG